MSYRFRAVIFAIGTLTLGGCSKTNYTMFALSSTGTLLQFHTDKPATLTSTVSLSNLPSGQSLVEIDYRPSDGALYGLTSGNQLCTINPSSGAVTVVSTTPFSTDGLVNATASFDPIHDQLRIISTLDNVLVDADTGVITTTGTTIAFDHNDTNQNLTPQLAGIAYSNNLAGATTTTLYALDVSSHSLVTVGAQGQSTSSSTDGGVLHTIGPVGVNFANAGFGIDEKNGDAYAALAPSGSASALYEINLGTGAASEIGTIGDANTTIISIAILPDAP